MGQPTREGMPGSSGAWLLWLLMVHVWRASCASQCTGSCTANLAAVCADDGKSYLNACIASCAGVEGSHEGYCKGEKIKFIQQSRTQLPAPNWRIAKESAAIITQDVIARFLQEGYVYRGKVALSKLPMFVKESTAADQVASTTTAADAAGGADTADVAASSTEGRNPTQAGNSSNNAQSEQKTASASSSTMVEVAVIRVDSSGNLYHKTYKYDPKKFPQTAYPPFDPSGSAAVMQQSAAGTPTAASTPAATQTGSIITITPPSSGPPIIGRTVATSPPPQTAKASALITPAPSAAGQAKAPAAASPPAPAATPAAAPKPPATPAAAPTPAKAPPPHPVAKPPSTPAKGTQFAEWVPPTASAEGDGSSSSSSSSYSTSGSSGAVGGAAGPPPSVPTGFDFFSMVEHPPAAPPSSPALLPASQVPSAPAADFFSMVDWTQESSAGGSSRTGLQAGEVLKPELGSYVHNNGSSSSSGGGVSSNSSSSNSSSSSSNSSSASGGAVHANLVDAATEQLLPPPDSSPAPTLPVTVVQPTVPPPAVPEPAPVVTQAGSADQPMGGVVTVTFLTDSDSQGDAELGPQDEQEEQQLQQQVQELLQQQQQQQALQEQQKAQPLPAAQMQQGQQAEPSPVLVQPEQPSPPPQPQQQPPPPPQEQQQQQASSNSESVELEEPAAAAPAAAPAPAPAPVPTCSSANMTCADRVTGMSRYFGIKTAACKYMDQVPMVGKARVAAVTMYYNKSSGCLRGVQVTYNHISHPTSFFTSVLLGSAVSSSTNVVVKTLKLGLREAVVKAEVYAPRCVQYVKLFTSKNNTILVGKVDPGGVVYTPTRNRPAGMLVAIRGFQDKAVYKSATKDSPPTVFPGVLKQLQFVWGETVCNCSIAAEAAAAADLPQAAVQVAGNSSSGSSLRLAKSSSSGRRLAEASTASAESQRLLEVRKRRLHQLWRRQQLSHDALAAEAAQLGMDSGGSDGGSLHYKHRLSTMLRHASVIGLGMDGNLPLDASPNIHRMLSVITPDTRLPCPLLVYPYKTLGQINAKASDGGFVCSGGLIGEDRVLTAGHCVWDDRDTQGPFQDLSFSPAQWKKDGKVTAPLGQVDWDYVTLFEAYVNDPDGEGLAYDVAVITLKRQVGKTLGFLGIKAEVSPCKTSPLALTLAGYPGDDPEHPIPGGWQGGCFLDTCTVNFSCSVSITNHTCDSYVGQSGAPMYDKDNYIRAVHTLGVLPGFSTSNGAITIQKYILDNVMGYWKESDGFVSAPPGSIGSGSYY